MSIDTFAGVEVDGRRLRRQQNRDTVIDALVSLFEEGAYQPSSSEIAGRAGLSPRSLFRYFDDVDDLNHAAIERQQALARPLLELEVGPEHPLEARIDAVVARRLRLFETIAPAARAARICAHRQPVVAAGMREGRSFLRHQVERLFAPELAGGRAGLLPALDVLCSFETYELLHGDQRLSRPKAAAALTSALTALLTEPGAAR